MGAIGPRRSASLMFSIRLRENGAAKGCLDFFGIPADTALVDSIFGSFRPGIPVPGFFVSSSC
jgi:hypothetical protein